MQIAKILCSFVAMYLGIGKKEWGKGFDGSFLSKTRDFDVICDCFDV